MKYSLTLVRALSSALVFLGMAAHAAEFRAGAGKNEVQITPEMLPLENLTSVHDPITVRVLLMDDGRDRTAIVVLEQPSVSEKTIASVKASLTRMAQVSPENAIVVGTHTTSAPHANMSGPGGGSGGPGGGQRPGGSGSGQASGPQPAGGIGQGPGAAAFSKALTTSADAAIAEANASLQPARIGFGTGTTDINVNRDLHTPRGVAFGSNPAGFSDKSVPVLRVDGADGKPLAMLMNVSVRSVVMDNAIDNSTGGKAVTADLAGAAARYVEKWYGGKTVALFIMGAAVDQAPVFEANRFVLNPDGNLTRVDMHETGFALLDLLGERLGSDVVATTESIKATQIPTVQIERRTLKVPSQGRSGGPPTNAPVLSYQYGSGPEIDFPVVLMRIGDVAIAGIQPELGSSVGAQIKAESPFPHTMVAVMVDGGAKYMVDAQSYDRFTNEARGSQFAKGAAAIAVTGIEDLLKQMKANEGAPAIR